MTLRSKIFVGAAAMAVLVLSSCAAQQETVAEEGAVAKQETVSQATPDRASDGMVCRRIRPTGSRMSQRVCKTAIDWERESEEDQDVIRERQSDVGLSSGSN